MEISGSLWRWPISKSLKSCAGVTFTAPVPNSHVDQHGVADDRDLAPGQRQLDLLADPLVEALVVGVHRHRGVAEHRLGPRGGDHQPLARPSGSG